MCVCARARARVFAWLCGSLAHLPAGFACLTQVEEEKREAVLDVEEAQETTQFTSLTLDRWQSYADELKKQIRSLGGEPHRWDGRGQVPPFKVEGQA